MRLTSTLAHDAVVAAVASLGAGVVSAYLFGSVGEDRAHDESDVDVGVLLDHRRWPGPRARFEARLLLTTRLAAALRRNVADVVILNDCPPLFARHVLTRGRRVSCSDEEQDHAFRRTVLSRAADLGPFLRRARRVKLEALGR